LIDLLLKFHELSFGFVTADVVSVHSVGI